MLFVVCFILAESIEIVARVYMPSYGQLGKSVTIVSLKISLENLIDEIFPLLGILFCFCLLAGLKKIISSLAFLLSLCAVICCQFSSLMRSTLLLEFQ